MTPLNEDTLVQQTTADYLEEQLDWQSVYAYNTETFGPEGTLGRKSDRETVLTRYLGEALVELNPGLPEKAYEEALEQGLGAIQVDGVMVDAASVRILQNIIDKADLIGM